jgi:serine/threonine-protein kinase
MVAPGARLGVYEVLAPIGAGGMGEVYRGRDTKLGRDVALKVLPEAFAADPERVARMHREAQVLAALNHPNIAAIYGFEDSGDVHALVLEFVDGETLADRIAHGPIPVDEVLPLAKQIAEALEAAHEQGIIHRDLKPANIKVRPDGTLKVLDFGLAKLAEPSAVAPTNPSPLSMSPTITSPALISAVGVLLGTAAYMSPEQAKGKPADKRSDIWAFGCVLFEMLTGKRAFGGDDVSDALAAVIRAEPDWTGLPPNTPTSIRRLLRRCLDKERKRRLESAADGRLDVEDALAAPIDETISGGTARRRHVPVAVVSTLAGALVSFFATWILTRPVPAAPSIPTRFEIIPTAELSLRSGNRNVAISPDGTRIAYVGSASATGTRRLVVRPLNALGAVPLLGTEGATSPFFSADGRWLAFFQDNELRKISIAGGVPSTICTLFEGGGTTGGGRGYASGFWGTDDTIFFAQGGNASPLQSVAAAGGQPKTLAIPDTASGEFAFSSPIRLPSRRALLLTVNMLQGRQTDHVDVLDLDTGRRKTLIPGGSFPQYVDTGYLLYLASGRLNAVPFDVQRLELAGAPTAAGSESSVGFSLSKNGTLVYVPGVIGSELLGGQRASSLELVWVDRRGKEYATGAPPRPYNVVRLSPDGERAAIDIREPSSSIWVWDFARGTLSPVALDAAGGTNPVWLPDGRALHSSRFETASEECSFSVPMAAGLCSGSAPARTSSFPKA